MNFQCKNQSNVYMRKLLECVFCTIIYNHFIAVHSSFMHGTWSHNTWSRTWSHSKWSHSTWSHSTWSHSTWSMLCITSSTFLMNTNNQIVLCIANCNNRLIFAISELPWILNSCHMSHGQGAAETPIWTIDSGYYECLIFISFRRQILDIIRMLNLCQFLRSFRHQLLLSCGCHYPN